MIKNKNRKTKTSNNVFKSVVREVIKDELIGTEKRLEQKFEKRLRSELQGVEQRLDKRLEVRLGEVEENLEQKLDEKTRNLPTKDEFFTSMDKVMGELQTVREEFTVHQGQHYEINERLDKLETSHHHS